MIDREKVLAVLRKRFPAAPPQDLAAAANAIVGLDEEWEEVSGFEQDLGYRYSVQCPDICFLAYEATHGTQFRIFRRLVGQPA